MNHTIIMSKYQGLGNDYLILDPKKNKVELQGKKVALLCQRGFGLGADGVLYGPVEMEGKLVSAFIMQMEVNLRSVVTEYVFCQISDGSGICDGEKI